jgi:hypothetical protein
MGGHFGASQVPGWDAAGPGHIEPALLGGAVTPACPVPPGRGMTGRRPTLTAAPAAISRSRRMALETVISPDIDSVASVASLANAPY